MMGMAAVIGAGVLLVNLVAYRHARAMLRFSGALPKSKNPEELSAGKKLVVLLSGIRNPRPVDTADPGTHGLRFQKHVVPVGADVTLGAWLVTREHAIGDVVLFHGYAASKSTLLLEARAFHDLGYRALLVDFRGSADSSESYTTAGYREADDVSAALSYAASTLGMTRPIIYARSMGAAAVLRAVATHVIHARGLILEGVFDQMLSTVKERFRAMGVPATPLAHLLVIWGGLQFSFWPFSHNPSTYAGACNLPVLMLHGTHDPRATLQQARAVYRAFPGRKQLCEFEGAKHEPLATANRARWDDAIAGFLASIDDAEASGGPAPS